MSRKGQFGSTAAPVQGSLLYGISQSLANRVCCFNRHYAEPSGSFEQTSFFRDVSSTAETTFYDSVTGLPLFVAPRGRTFAEFAAESRSHGWPSFRDEEVVWDNVRCLPDGECVSLAGTHLGHNLPDGGGLSGKPVRNRYCINLCSVAGRPAAGQ
jgi:peptide methionine sulfoxide reductase MsrB